MLALLSIPALASAGTVPIVPDPYGTQASQAYAVANTTHAGVVESLTITSPLNMTGFHSVGCSQAPCQLYGDNTSTVNVSWGSDSILSVSTTITPLTGPYVNLQQTHLNCSGTIVNYSWEGSFSFANYCSSLQLIGPPLDAFPTGFSGPVLLQYTIVRSVTLRYGENVSWTRSGSTVYAPLSVTTPSPGATSPKLTGFSINQVSLAVGFPSGNWNPATASLFDRNATTSYSGPQLFAGPTSMLVQWTAYPGGTIRVYTGSVSGSGSGTSGTKNTTAANGTYPGAGAPTLPSTIDLTWGAPAENSQGVFATSVQWYNNLSGNFSGSFNIIASWLPQLNSSVLYVNGQALPTSQWSVAGGSVFIVAGAVNVTNGSSVTFSLAYTLTQPTLSSALFYFDGVAVTLPLLVLVGGLIAAGVIAYFAVLWTHKARFLTLKGALALALLIVFACAVMVL